MSMRPDIVYRLWPKSSNLYAFAATFYLAADTGFLTSAGAMAVAVIVSILSREAAIYSLFMVASVQDARGFENRLWYPTFAIVGVIFILKSFFDNRFRSIVDARRWGISTQYLILVSAGVAVVLYAFFVSLLNIQLQGLQQSLERQPVFLAGLMVFMIVIGMLCSSVANIDENVRKNIGLIALLSVTNGLAIITLQAFFGPTIFASTEGVTAIEGASQLMTPTLLGFPRLVGTYLTPNGFALCMALLMLVIIGVFSREQSSSGRLSVWLYVGTGLLLTMLTLSKSILILFLLSGLVLMTMQYGFIRVALRVSLVAVVLILLFATKYGWSPDSFASILRIPNADTVNSTYRGEAWNVVAQNFTTEDWVFGTGLSYWPSFFKEHLGFALADPHTWILSIPGTFGIPGMIFYGLLGFMLTQRMKSSYGAIRFITLTLIILIFIIGLFEIPYVLNNAPLSFLIWFCFGLVFSSKEGSNGEKLNEPTLLGSKISR